MHNEVGTCAEILPYLRCIRSTREYVSWHFCPTRFLSSGFCTGQRIFKLYLSRFYLNFSCQYFILNYICFHTSDQRYSFLELQYTKCV